VPGKPVYACRISGIREQPDFAVAVEPVALKVAARLPQTSDPCGKVTFGLKSNQSEHMEVSRIDWQASDKHSIFVRFFVTDLIFDHV